MSGAQLAQLMFPQFDPKAKREFLTRGMAASPGAAVGKVVFDSPTAKAWAESGEDVVLVRRETNPDDLAGMIAAQGILTASGGKTSHAAVVARGMGKTCVCGAEEMDVDVQGRSFSVGGVVVNEGDMISIDGSTGEVFIGAAPVVPSPAELYIEQGLEAALDGADEETADLVRAVDRLLSHADATRRLAVRANADTAEDAERARRLGAQGIGLCRTEHMFLGDRRSLIERVILAEGDEERDAALQALLPLQRADFIGLLDEMDGLPVTIRLLDPPLHEFLPGPHRARGEGRRRGGDGFGGSQGRPAAGRSGAAARDEPDARAAWGAPRPADPRTVRAADPRDRGGGLFATEGRQGPAGRDHGAAGRLGDGALPGPRRDRRDSQGGGG